MTKINTPGQIQQQNLPGKLQTNQTKKSLAVDFDFSKLGQAKLNQTTSAQVSKGAVVVTPPEGDIDGADAESGAKLIMGSLERPEGGGNPAINVGDGSFLAQLQSNEVSMSGADDFDFVNNLGRNGMSPEETERISNARREAEQRIAQLADESSHPSNEQRAQELAKVAAEFFQKLGITPNAEQVQNFLKLDPQAAQDSPFLSLAMVTNLINPGANPDESRMPRAFLTLEQNVLNKDQVSANSGVSLTAAVAAKTAPAITGGKTDPKPGIDIKF